ncbi:MAG: N-acetyl-gamma-glutamyl-phosphate reductase [Rickettsiales bacterium]
MHPISPDVNCLVAGASGYTGAELMRLLVAHPCFRVAALTGERSAGKPLADVYPHLRGARLPDVISQNDVVWDEIDLVFACLPHGASQSFVASVPDRVKVVDLSADFRLRDVRLYASAYGAAHVAPQLQKTAIYGLTEFAREAVAAARLVACPGCYPTAAALPLIPLLQRKLIEPNEIIVDAKSGISGAGRGAKEANLYAEIDGDCFAYGVGVHRHSPEMAQTLSDAAGESVSLHFTPQVIPAARGMLACMYVKTKNGASSDAIRAALQQAYANERFVRVLPKGALPRVKNVRFTNMCEIAVAESSLDGRAVVISAIDNLLKGASGQALQNANLMFGMDEGAGLPKIAAYP